MNSTQVVRTDADASGVNLRLWIDDEEGRHVTVAELRLGHKTMRDWLRAVALEQERTDQPSLPYEG